MRITVPLIVLVTASASAQSGMGELAALQTVLHAAVQRAAPWVVTVETFGGGRVAPDASGFVPGSGASTGVVLRADGWVATSTYALVLQPTTILVTLDDGRSLPAEVAGKDTSRGLVLLHVDASDLPVPELAPREELRVGQWVAALGRTFGGSEPSVEVGIVSATGRLFGRAVQTDANTSPADYGGPLIDVEGRVVGVVVPMSRTGRDASPALYDSGIGFAVTLDGLKPQLARMRAGEELHRGWLGIDPGLRDLGPGAIVKAVTPDGPAAQAGLRAGERLVTVDGVTVRNAFHLRDLVDSHMAGESIRIGVVAGDGSERAVDVALVAVPEHERKAVAPDSEAGEPPPKSEGR